MTDFNNKEYDDDTKVKYDSDDGIEFIEDDYSHEDYDYEVDDEFTYPEDTDIPQYSDDYHDDPNYKRKKQQKTSMGEEILSYVKILAVAIVVAFLFTRFIIVNAQVPSGSMENTILTGDRLIGFRLAYLFNEPERGDIVIFKYPDDESQNFVKRVIGVPGDVIQITGGHVYVNGDMLEESYIREPMNDDGEELTYVVPEDSYFMLGDNRNNSKDSRYWTHTFVSRDKIIAKVSFRYCNVIKKKLSFAIIK
ncbi:MAG: signal peptidase I [Lachnospira sp.]